MRGSLVGDWRVSLPEALILEVKLDGLVQQVHEMLGGRVCGRVLVNHEVE